MPEDYSQTLDLPDALAALRRQPFVCTSSEADSTVIIRPTDDGFSSHDPTRHHGAKRLQALRSIAQVDMSLVLDARNLSTLTAGVMGDLVHCNKIKAAQAERLLCICGLQATARKGFTSTKLDTLITEKVDLDAACEALGISSDGLKFE